MWIPTTAWMLELLAETTRRKGKCLLQVLEVIRSTWTDPDGVCEVRRQLSKDVARATRDKLA